MYYIGKRLSKLSGTGMYEVMVNSYKKLNGGTSNQSSGWLPTKYLQNRFIKLLGSKL